MAERLETSTAVFLTSLIWSDYEASADAERLDRNSSDLEDDYHALTGTQPTTSGGPPPGADSFVPVIVFVVLMVATIIENLLVIIAYCLNKSLQVYFNYFILSMAIGDLAVGLIDMPLSLMFAVLGYWPFGNVACALFALFDNVLIHISILSVLVICVDRHYSIVSPLKHLHSRGVRRALVLILPVYLMSLLGWGSVVASLWLVSSKEKRPSGGQCFLPMADKLGYRIGFEIALYWVPLVILIVLYSRVVLAIRRRQKNLDKMRKRESPTASAQPKKKVIEGPVANSKKTDQSAQAAQTSPSEQKQTAGTQLASTDDQAPGDSSATTSRRPGDVRDSRGINKDDNTSDSDVDSNRLAMEARNMLTVGEIAEVADRKSSQDADENLGITEDDNNANQEVEANSPGEDRATKAYNLLTVDEITTVSDRKVSPKAGADDLMETLRMTPDDNNADLEMDIKTAEEDKAVEEKAGRARNWRIVSQVVVGAGSKSLSEALREKKEKKDEECSNAKKKGVVKFAASAAKISRSNMKPILTLSFIALAVVVSWTPWAVLNIVERVSPAAVSPIIIETSIFWVYLNSALNPLCYAAGNENFRRAMLNLLRGKCNRRN